MLRVGFTADGFSAGFAEVNGNHNLELDWPTVVWSAITVGRREFPHVLRHGLFSWFEIAYRAALIFANLCGESGQIRRSPAYDGLDPSEKGAVSYFLGLTMAKAFAERRLGVPWLMHLDVYREELQPVLEGQSRPDLVGQTTDARWVGIEAKGRTNDVKGPALERAKNQARLLRTVAGEEPLLRVGMVSHFRGGNLQLAISDPEARRDEKALDLPLSRDQLQRDYYRPFRTWLSQEPAAHKTARAKHAFVAAHLSAVDLTVGLAVDLFGEEPPVTRAAEREVPKEEAFYVGSDGVLVELGSLWSTENMAREPRSRTKTSK